MRSVGVCGALLVDFTHEPADVLARVPGQLDYLALLHALPHGVGHGDGQRGTGVVGALLGSGLGAHCLPQRSDGLFGGGHVDMFAHRGGHTEVRHPGAHSVLTCGHMNVASWMWRIKRSKHPHLSHPLNLPKDQYMAVSKRLRYEILRRDQHTCRYCGASAPAVPLRVDHVTPVALGGTDEPANLVTACEDCNSGKTSSTPDAAVVADVQQHQLRWGRAMELAAQQQSGQQQEKEANWKTFQQAWNTWASVWRPGVTVADLPDNWKQSIEALRVAGLPAGMWPDIVETGMTNPGVQDHFRYCCGIAWRRVRELQDRAREILEQQDRELMQTILDGWRELGTVADTWCEAWRDASPDGVEPKETPQQFKDSLSRGINAGLSIEVLRAAAQRAGTNLDADLMAHLSDEEEVQD